MSTLVSLRNITKTYQRGPEKVQVLHGIDLDIARGDFHRRRAHRPDERRPAVDLAQPPRRLRVPVLQPDADADRAEERRAAAAADPPQRRAAQAQCGDRADPGRPGRPPQPPPE
ncbi:hypothetical protein G6F22_020434 [Rhizopus arrhizus]|nr:hypothetical protein G6F22_020434 [Rhizopus arrhizus]